jgi:hypothetical protein
MNGRISLVTALVVAAVTIGCSGSTDEVRTDATGAEADSVTTAKPEEAPAECTPRSEGEGDDVYTLQGPLGPLASPASLGYVMAPVDELRRSLDSAPDVADRFGQGSTILDPVSGRQVFLSDDSFVNLQSYMEADAGEILVAYAQPPQESPEDPGFATLVAVQAEDGSARILNAVCADPLEEVLAAVATESGLASTWDVMTALAGDDPDVLRLLEGDPRELLADAQAAWLAAPPIERVLLESAGAPAEVLARYELRELAIAIPATWAEEGFSAGETDICVLVPEGRGPSCISTALQMAAYSETEGQVEAPPIGKIPVPVRDDQPLQLILRIESGAAEFTYTPLTSLDPSVFSQSDLPLVRLPADLRGVENAAEARESASAPEVFDAFPLIGNLELGAELVANDPISDELKSYRIS